MQHQFVKPNTEIPDSQIFYSDVYNMTEAAAFAYDIHLQERTSGTATITFERAVKADGHFTTLKDAGSIAAVGHVHGAVNSRTTEAQVLGFVRVKIDLAAASGVGMKFDITVNGN